PPARSCHATRALASAPRALPLATLYRRGALGGFSFLVPSPAVSVAPPGAAGRKGQGGCGAAHRRPPPRMPAAGTRPRPIARRRGRRRGVGGGRWGLAALAGQGGGGKTACRVTAASRGNRKK